MIIWQLKEDQLRKVILIIIRKNKSQLQWAVAVKINKRWISLKKNEREKNILRKENNNNNKMPMQ